jgi:hypothetical protein
MSGKGRFESFIPETARLSQKGGEPTFANLVLNGLGRGPTAVHDALSECR